jgi:hypothetical protein
MKLNDTSTKQLFDLISAANIVNIDKLVIEQDIIRGADEKRSVCLVAKNNIPNFDGDTVGINRVGVLLTRLRTC